jgi:two-component system response regulator
VNVDDLIGETPLKFVHPEDRLTVTQNLKKRIEGEEEFVHYTVRVISKNGEIVTVEVFGSMATIGGKPAIIGTLLDITETVRLNRLLRIINDISKTIVREKDKNEILRRVVRDLTEFEEYEGSLIGLVEGEMFLPVAGVKVDIPKKIELKEYKCLKEVVERKELIVYTPEDCPFYRLNTISVPMLHNDKVYGVLLLFSRKKEISSDEAELIQTLANDVAFAIEALEVEELQKKAFEQINRNIEQFAILVDEIRNPLAVISGLAETSMSEAVYWKIKEQIGKIEKLCERLEEGWLESEKIRGFLKKFGY